jgi:V-type H+-transporting ATPase subunit a
MAHRSILRPRAEAASGLWRSEDMVKLDLILQRDAIHHVVQAVADTGCAQFIDIGEAGTAFSRPFTGDIRRCEDVERRLRFFLEQMRAAKVNPFPGYVRGETKAWEPISATALDHVERELEVREAELRQANSSIETLHEESRRLREEYEVATRDVTAKYISVEAREEAGVTSAPTLVVNGTIPDRSIETISRMVFRITRGNVYIRFDPIEEPFVSTDPLAEPVRKSVFVIYLTTEKLHKRVTKLAESLGANIFSADGSRLRPPTELAHRIDTLRRTLDLSRGQRFQMLDELSRDMEELYRVAGAFRAIYGAMNLMEIRTGDATAKARVWIPVADFDTFTRAVEVGCERSGESTAPIIEVCNDADQIGQPTFFRTNKVTSIFQGIVDSYGVARYKEVNPGVFTIVTFPYLFGIMYGDIGHGILLTLFAGALLVFERGLERQKLNEIFAMIFGGRYLLFGMGLFAIYVGLLYNDCFGFNVGLFQSAYQWPPLPSPGDKDAAAKHGGHGKASAEPKGYGIVHPTHPDGKPNVKPYAPYAFGIDVAWAETDNKLEFYNSVKMKCAVIIGVVQMLAGIGLSLLNHLRRKDMRHVWFSFVPEVVFLSFTFGYMALLIIVKWVTPWPNTNLAPSLLETMTNFFLAPGHVPSPVFAGQAFVQVLLLFVAFSMVPLMLCVIPYLEYKDHHTEQVAAPTIAKRGAYSRVADGETGEEMALKDADGHPDEEEAEAEWADEHGGHGGHGGAHFDFSEVVIHYIIHTIEFVLGCVSNTASYLRLWALSLAHAQLSEVFLNFALMASVGADGGSGFITFMGFAVWISATIGVLLGMESLSAFLHALRLHWVEFQTKFYGGDGKPFMPLKISEVTALPV